MQRGRVANQALNGPAASRIPARRQRQSSACHNAECPAHSDFPGQPGPGEKRPGARRNRLSSIADTTLPPPRPTDARPGLGAAPSAGKIRPKIEIDERPPGRTRGDAPRKRDRGRGRGESSTRAPTSPVAPFSTSTLTFSTRRGKARSTCASPSVRGGPFVLCEVAVPPGG